MRCNYDVGAPGEAHKSTVRQEQDLKAGAQGAFAVETAWYALVAVAFSAERPRHGYLRSKLWIDRMAGAGRGCWGLKLMSELH
jgi:hypothetical protein